MTQETKKHPHDAVIRAWLDGKTVQYKHGGEWLDMLTQPGDGGTMPAFLIHREHRIKPEDQDVFVFMSAYNGDPNYMNLVDPDRVACNKDAVKMKLSKFKELAGIKD